MRGFLKYIAGLFMILLVAMVVLDFVYSTAFKRGSYINKVMWMHDMEGQSLDFVVFGSSRANNYVMPNLIFEKTGANGVNMAIQASGPLEIELAVKEYLKQNTAKRFFIQVDDIFYKENPDQIGQLSWLPYITDDEIYEVFEPFGNEYFFYKHIPFYRYLQFDTRLGYRNVLYSSLKKGKNYNGSRGYKVANGHLKMDKPYRISLRDHHNIHFTTINKICSEKNVEVIYFTAPIYSPVGNFDVLEKYLPNYHDFSNELQDITLFRDAKHVNGKGAEAFTLLFIEKFFQEPNQ